MWKAVSLCAEVISTRTVQANVCVFQSAKSPLRPGMPKQTSRTTKHESPANSQLICQSKRRTSRPERRRRWLVVSALRRGHDAVTLLCVCRPRPSLWGWWCWRWWWACWRRGAPWSPSVTDSPPSRLEWSPDSHCESVYVPHAFCLQEFDSAGGWKHLFKKNFIDSDILSPRLQLLEEQSRRR